MREGKLLSHSRYYSYVMLHMLVLGCVASACSFFQLLCLEGFVKVSRLEPRRSEPWQGTTPFRRGSRFRSRPATYGYC